MITITTWHDDEQASFPSPFQASWMRIVHEAMPVSIEK